MENPKEYSNGEVTIVWKPEICIHSAICAKGLPHVFQPREKPWIKQHADSSENLIGQVKKCPSGALSFYINNEKNTSMTDSSFILNETKKRFELEVDGHIAFIEYILNNENIMFLTHTEVPQALEGKGVGSSIVLKALHYIKDHDYTLAPLCPFVAKYLRIHPEWQTLLAKGYKV